jgi:hypothetical protein
MKRIALMTVVAALPLTLYVPGVQAQSSSQGAPAAIDASKMLESGPAMVGGTGQTVGPNSMNQSVMPMPGVAQDEQLSQLPPSPTPPLVTPAAGPQPSPLRPKATR